MKIKFEKICLSEDKRSVVINGKYKRNFLKISLSILEIAKVWGTDKTIIEKVRNSFGSEEYEDGCNETREKISDFPNIKIENNLIEIDEIDLVTKDESVIKLIGEDITGWGNEGIEILIPLEAYRKLRKQNPKKMFLESKSITIEGMD
jgi:hypothetical protein